jgi:hypothetical protein
MFAYLCHSWPSLELCYIRWSDLYMLNYKYIWFRLHGLPPPNILYTSNHNQTHAVLQQHTVYLLVIQCDQIFCKAITK